MEYRINNECSFLSPKKIEVVEEYYGAKYVCETCLYGKHGQWLNFPAAIFYTEGAHPDGSNYFALFFDPSSDRVKICDGLKHVCGYFNAVVADDGEVLYSRYRHDYRRSKDGSVMVDGGRDYFRYEAKTVVLLAVNKDKLVIVPTPGETDDRT
jgi:hypothetical protein